LTLTAFSARGDEFEYEDEFHINGLILEGLDEIDEPIPEEIEAVGISCDRTTPETDLITNEDGLIWANGQPNQTCRIEFDGDEEEFYSKEVEEEIEPNEDDPTESFTLYTDRLLNVSVETIEGEPVDGFEVGYEVQNSETEDLVEQLDLKTEGTTDGSGELELEGIFGQ